MKKVISSILIVLLLFNFIFSNNKVFADEDQNYSKAQSAYRQPVDTENSTGITDLIDSGTVSRKNGSSEKTSIGFGSFGASAVGMVTGLLALLIDIFVVQIDVAMGVISTTEESNGNYFWFSIDRAVFNRIALFNINYFNTEDYKVGDNEITANQSNTKIKEGIVDIYYICRLLGLSLILLVLIYIGIRMAISTVASEQAKYKKMLISWIESVVLVFLMLYIISAVISFGEIITGMLYNIREKVVQESVDAGLPETFEITIHEKIINSIKDVSGLELTRWSIIYWILLFMEIKFFWLYLKRLLMVGLLIIISPLITITYSIDKAGDGKAQVFFSWMQEFVINVLIQPLHALIYLVFVVTANSIAEQSPIVAIALLMAMGTVERMVKVIFNMKGLATLRGVDKFLKKEEG